MTLRELHRRIGAAMADDPRLSDVPVFLEGCDCWGTPSGDIRLTKDGDEVCALIEIET